MQRYSLLITLFLASCIAGVPPVEVIRGMEGQWAGQRSEAFFTSYGAPAGQTAVGGGTRYRWVSILEPPPGTVSPLHSFTAGGRTYGFIDSSGENTGPRFCELRIEADGKGLIRHITMLHDDIGKHSNSYCREIFQ